MEDIGVSLKKEVLDQLDDLIQEGNRLELIVSYA